MCCLAGLQFNDCSWPSRNPKLMEWFSPFLRVRRHYLQSMAWKNHSPKPKVKRHDWFIAHSGLGDEVTNAQGALYSCLKLHLARRGSCHKLGWVNSLKDRPKFKGRGILCSAKADFVCAIWDLLGFQWWWRCHDHPQIPDVCWVMILFHPWNHSGHCRELQARPGFSWW